LIFEFLDQDLKMRLDSVIHVTPALVKVFLLFFHFDLIGIELFISPS
jgi:hypothetical protein